MKKIFMFIVAAAMMASCSKDVLDETAGAGENQKAANSVLQVTTRSGGEATISYPVQVYVFQGEECKTVQTIGDAGQTLNIALVEGTYSVYAVGGASSSDYTLPAKEDATTTSALTLKEGKAMTDLMAASATATLVDGGTNTVTLGLQRKVMLIQDVTINKVPTAATAIALADVDAISDWCLPTFSELDAVRDAREDISGKLATPITSADNYLYATANGAVRYRSLLGTGDGAENFGATARVRPVVTVTIAKE